MILVIQRFFIGISRSTLFILSLLISYSVFANTIIPNSNLSNPDTPFINGAALIKAIEATKSLPLSSSVKTEDMVAALVFASGEGVTNIQKLGAMRHELRSLPKENNNTRRAQLRIYVPVLDQLYDVHGVGLFTLIKQLQNPEIAFSSCHRSFSPKY